MSAIVEGNLVGDGDSSSDSDVEPSVPSRVQPTGSVSAARFQDDDEEEIEYFHGNNQIKQVPAKSTEPAKPSKQTLLDALPVVREDVEDETGNLTFGISNCNNNFRFWHFLQAT